MCFNLFGPLVMDAGLATRLFQALLGRAEVEEVHQVLIEHAPSPPNEYLGDGTSFDAFVDYSRPGGSRALVGIETKLTDQFTKTHYPMSHTPAYRKWSMHPDSPFRQDMLDRLPNVRHNQLWRDHMLVVALAHHSQRRYAGGTMMLVRHPRDTEGDQTVQGYRRLLTADDRTFMDVTLDHLIDAWDAVAQGEAETSWLAAFRRRYLDLTASEEEWRRYRGPASGSHGAASS